VAAGNWSNTSDINALLSAVHDKSPFRTIEVNRLQLLLPTFCLWWLRDGVDERFCCKSACYESTGVIHQLGEGNWVCGEVTDMGFDQRYFDDDTRVRLYCEGSDCWAEIRRRAVALCGECSVDPLQELGVELEFLLQPRDNAQRPMGQPLLLHTEHFRLQQDQRTGWLYAWTWLPPQLTPLLLTRCHVRLQFPVGSETQPPKN
jgi:hypothetical protein